MDNAISIRGVRKTFGTKVAVDNLDLSIKQGSVCGFIGPNGAGKTTTIRMIMSIIFPDSGTVEVLGRKSALESKDRIGYLPEERGLYKKMKVGAFLNYIAQLKGIGSAGIDKEVKEWLAKVGLENEYKKKCEELSKGMQQKIQFIATVIHKPDLVILDEPFSGLDPVNRKLLRELIDEQSNAGRTIIFSTHAMFEAEELCDQIFMIHQGKKMLDGPLHGILQKFDPHALLVELQDSQDLTLLRSLPCIESVDPSRQRGKAKDLLQVRLHNGSDTRTAMAQIVSAVPVNRIELQRAELEDIFIDLVTESGGMDESVLSSLAGRSSSLKGGV